MRFLSLALLRLLQTVAEVALWAVILALLIRLAIVLNPTAGMNSWGLLISLRHGLDPVLASIGSAIGVRWPTDSGLARYFPLALAVVVYATKSVVSRVLRFWRFKVLESAEPRRERPRKPAPENLVSDAKSRDELLKQYRDIEKKLQSARKARCAFLNVDVVGSTRMKTGETPTTIAASFQAYEELLRRIFQKNQAWKQSWTPDGVLICFHSREDAVRAAQQLLGALQHFNSSENRLRMPFRVRCGLSEGDVAIFEDTNLSTFSDPVIDTAAHMQKEARPNSLWLSEEICAGLPDHDEFRNTGRDVDGWRVCEWSLDPLPEGAEASLAAPSQPAPLTPVPGAGRPNNAAAAVSAPAHAPAMGSTERTIAVHPDATQSVRTIGRYEIIEELGRGAMGAVYKALDPQIGRTVALKVVITRGLASDELRTQKERFYREARAAGKLTHPGIVAIYDVAEDAYGSPYLVMEFVEGTTLDKALSPGGAAQGFTFAQRLGLAIEIASALDYAHRNGVIHRDIKPSNILMTADRHAKIADFGIAKLVGSQATIGGQILGTPAFVSPEQLVGSPADARSDIFSMGVMLYWIFTGERPFHGETMTSISYKVVHTTPPPARQLNWALPEELDKVLARCLAKNPAERYQSAGELAAELEALRVGRGVPSV